MINRKDITLLFSTRIVRLFAYGFLSVVLALYLAEAGLSAWSIGVLFSLTLAGDAGVSLWLTTSADRLGRRRMLIVGAALMVIAGAVFLSTRNVMLLALAAIIGVISPSGNEIGPFLSIEQASLTQLLPAERRTGVFAWYNLAGSFATALGALSGGWLSQALQAGGWTRFDSYRAVLAGYALAGLVIMLCFFGVSRAVEVPAAPSRRSFFGLHKSRAVVLKLSALFSVDAFAGGLVVQSLVAYWFSIRFGADPGIIGSIFFGANVLAGISALLAVRLAARIGLINDGVHPHPLEHPPDPGAPDAHVAAGNCRAVGALQHLTDGCADPAVVHHGRGGARRALGRLGCYDHRPVCGRLHGASPDRRSAGRACAHQRAFHTRRQPQVDLRSDAVAAIPRGPTTGRTPLMTMPRPKGGA